MADNPVYIWRLEQQSIVDGDWKTYDVRYYESPKHPSLKDKVESIKVANRNHRQRTGNPDRVRSRLFRYVLEFEEDISRGSYATQAED